MAEESQKAIDEDKYLTPYQRIQESIGLGQRGLNAQVAAYEARPPVTPNPLLEERELLEQATVPTAITTPPPRPNALVQPPVPLSTMPVTQQIAWQKLQDKTRADRATLEATLLKTDVDRRTSELREEEIAQSREMMKELPALQSVFKTGDTKAYENYPELKAELQRRFPAAAGSVEVDRVLNSLDARYNKLLSVDEGLRAAELNRKGAAQQKRMEAGYTEAEKLGEDVVREYAALAETSPKEASEFLAKAQIENVKTQLGGIYSPEEIARIYGGEGTGREFKYAAALAAQKVRAAQAMEQQRATANFSTLDKMRVASGFDPTDAKQLDTQGKPKDPFAESEGWTPDMEAAWRGQRDYLIKLIPQIPGNRAGVTGTPAQQQPVTAPPPPQAAPAVTTEPPRARGKSGRQYVWVNGGWYPAEK